MSDDQLKLVAAAVIFSLFSSSEVSTPISSLELLTHVISHGPPDRLFDTGPAPPFRLTDLSRFEAILESLATQWDHGFMIVLRDETGVTVMDVQLGSGSKAGPGSPSAGNARKRKRIVDEEADSAAGSDEEPEDVYEEVRRPVSALESLGKELKEVYSLLQKSTAKGRLLAEQFHSANTAFEPICPHITKDECIKSRVSSTTPNPGHCNLIHFRPLIRPHTDPALGHCSYLNTCYSEPTYAQSPSIPPLPSANAQMNAQWPKPQLPSGLGAGGRGKEKAPCRYLHYEVDWDPADAAKEGPKDNRPMKKPFRLGIGLGPSGKLAAPLPPQWISCDVRKFDCSVLGKFHVIMADPPWDIHMSLPYGTMTDDEMRAMPIPALQDEGLLFLWVTGRAMEVGRECLRHWGYTRVDEVIWVKTNQLQRVIRTGRTGHWLNHTKEHMLVGVKTKIDEKGNLVFPSWANRGLDTDVIVSEVRETSRKPDEVYGLIERMCPGGRKIEIFGRRHNTRPGWLTLGNQLGGDQIYEEDLIARMKEKYPERMINVPVGNQQMQR